MIQSVRNTPWQIVKKIKKIFFVVSLLHDLDFIVGIFPLHDKEDIKLIEHDWFMSKDALFKSQDISKRNKKKFSPNCFLF